jgi:hypothetical protein
VGGYGTVNQLSSYINYGRQLKPDLVILGFNSADFENNISSPLRCEDVGSSVQCRMKWKPEVEKVREITRLIPFYDYLANHSHLLNLFRHMLLGRVAVVERQKHRARAQDDVLYKKSVELTERYIVSLNRILENDGVRFVLVQIPIIDDYVYERPSGNILGKIVGINEGWRYENMKRICNMRKIECINPIDELAELKLSYESLFFQVDGHLTVSGHSHVANIIYEHLDI